MCKCRTSKPGFSTSPEFFDEPLSDEFIEERSEEFWTWATAKSLESRTIFQCGIDSLMDDEDNWLTFWTELTNAVSDGKFPDLKKHMKPYIETTVENFADDWS